METYERNDQLFIFCLLTNSRILFNHFGVIFKYFLMVIIVNLLTFLLSDIKRISLHTNDLKSFLDTNFIVFSVKMC